MVFFSRAPLVHYSAGLFPARSRALPPPPAPRRTRAGQRPWPPLSSAGSADRRTPPTPPGRPGHPARAARPARLPPRSSPHPPSPAALQSANEDPGWSVPGTPLSLCAAAGRPRLPGRWGGRRKPRCGEKIPRRHTTNTRALPLQAASSSAARLCSDASGKESAPARRHMEYLQEVEAGPFSTGGGTRHVQLVRREGRDVSSLYRREGGGGVSAAPEKQSRLGGGVTRRPRWRWGLRERRAGGQGWDVLQLVPHVDHHGAVIGAIGVAAPRCCQLLHRRRVPRRQWRRRGGARLRPGGARDSREARDGRAVGADRAVWAARAEADVAEGTALRVVEEQPPGHGLARWLAHRDLERLHRLPALVQSIKAPT